MKKKTVPKDILDDLAGQIVSQQREIDRLKAGKFTQEEIHNICHDLEKTVSAQEFAEGCMRQQRALYGWSPCLTKTMEDVDRYSVQWFGMFTIKRIHSNTSDAFKLWFTIKDGSHYHYLGVKDGKVLTVKIGYRRVQYHIKRVCN